MLTADIARQSCLASAKQWRGQAVHIREHAVRDYLRPEQREALLTEAQACDRQANWWLEGADDYLLGGAAAGLEALQ
jgi:hypothetical protein